MLRAVCLEVGSTTVFPWKTYVIFLVHAVSQYKQRGELQIIQTISY